MTASVVSCPSVSCPLLNDPAGLRRAVAAANANEEMVERERLLLALHHRWPGRVFTFDELKAAMVDGSAGAVLDALPEWYLSKVGKGDFSPLLSLLRKAAGVSYGEFGARLVVFPHRMTGPSYTVVFEVSLPPLPGHGSEPG